MPRRKRPIPTPDWERHHSAIGRTIAGRSPQFYATVGIVLLVIVAVGIVGYGLIADYRAKQHRPDSTAVKVDNTEYTLKYFTQRLKTYVQQNGGPTSQTAQPQTAIPAVTEQIVEDAIVLRYAPDEGLTASADDVKSDIATTLGIPASDPNYQARFQELLTTSGLTEEQYLDMAKANVLRKKLTDKFTAALPASAESVHYRQIVVGSQGEADDLKKQIEGGADFVQLAATNSLDTQTKSKGGDEGWIPKGVLPKALEDTVFALDVNGVTTYPAGSNVYVIQVTEKQADKPIDAAQKPTLANKALLEWLQQKRGTVTVDDVITTDTDQQQWAVDRAYAAA